VQFAGTLEIFGSANRDGRIDYLAAGRRVGCVFGRLETAAGPRPVHTTMEQTRVLNLLQLINKHPRATFYVAPAGQPQTFEVKGEVMDRNTNLTVNVTAYIDAADMATMLALTNVQVGFVHPSAARTTISAVGSMVAYGAFLIGLVCLLVFVQSSAATGFRSRVYQKPDVRWQMWRG
jgi:hypothetical protein